MVKFFKDFWYEEDAMGTIEIVIIIAVLVAIAIIFKDTISDFAGKLMEDVFNSRKEGEAVDNPTGSKFK